MVSQKKKETNIRMLCNVFLDHLGELFSNIALSFYLISFQAFDVFYLWACRVQLGTTTVIVRKRHPNTELIARKSKKLRTPQVSRSGPFLELLRSTLDGHDGHAVAVKWPIPRIPPSPGWLNCCLSVLLVEIFMKSCDRGSSHCAPQIVLSRNPMKQP